MIGAALLAKKAVEQGLTRKPWVKTTLAPGLEGRHRLLRAGRPDAVPGQARLQPGRLRLHHLHRQLRPAASPRSREAVNDARPRRRLGAVRQPQLRGPDQPRREDELPGLAAAGRRLRAGRHDGHRPRSTTRWARTATATTVFLQDIWPTPSRGRGGHRRARSPPRCSPSDYADVFAGDERWQSLPTPDGRHLRVGRGLDLRPQAAVLRRHAGASRRRSTDIDGARVLAKLGDSVTTDHISPGRRDQGGPPGRASTSPSTASSAGTSTPTARGAATTR